MNQNQNQQHIYADRRRDVPHKEALAARRAR
jgi:hypothetical protein